MYSVDEVCFIAIVQNWKLKNGSILSFVGKRDKNKIKLAC